MTLRKVADPPRLCEHREHHPPSFIVLEPGVWEHTCPGCGRVSHITVPERGFQYPITAALPQQKDDEP